MADDQTGSFNTTAVTLSRNPLGLLALFIVLIYGMAALTITVPNSLAPGDRTTIVYFLVFFPVLVLILFGILVTRYAKNLYAPSDFADQKDWVALQKQAIAELATATAFNQADAGVTPPSADIIESSESAVKKATAFARSSRRSNGILWVDDNPAKVAGLRRTFEEFNIPVVSATGSDGAVSLATQRPFDAIVTDMEHDGDKAAGYTLAERLKAAKVDVPVIIFTTAKKAAAPNPKRKLVTAVTGNASELFQQVTQAVNR